jgi:hypothetical protein
MSQSFSASLPGAVDVSEGHGSGRVPDRSRIDSPYPGLRPFEAKEYSLFFGRQQQIADVKARLSQHHFVAVVGGSGCGKSSLVRAGIIPELQLGGIPGTGSFWVPIAFTPGTDPIGRLALSFSEVLEWPEAERETGLQQIKYTLRQLHGLSALLSDFRSKLRVEGGPAALRERANLLILVDQFEEIFRRENRGKSDVERLVRLIEDSYQHQDERIFMILTMRSEDLHHCAEFHVLTQALNSVSYLVPRLDDSSLEEIIVGPAERHAARVVRAAGGDPREASVRFDSRVKALIHAAVEEMKGDPDHLPLLQHLLFRLWEQATERSRGKAAPSEIVLEDLAGASGTPVAELEENRPGLTRSLLPHALDHHAELVFGSLEPAAAPVAQSMFSLMGIKDERKNYKRRFTNRNEIGELSGADSSLVDGVIRRFTTPHPYVRDDSRRDRSLPTCTDLTDVDRKDLDVAHEALIRNWGRLRDWIDTESDRAQCYGVLIQRFKDNEPLERRELRQMSRDELAAISPKQGAKYARELGLIADGTADSSDRDRQAADREWSTTHGRALGFLARAQRRQWLSLALIAVIVVAVPLLVAYSFVRNVAHTVSEREIGTFRSLAIAGDAATLLNPDQSPRQRAVHLVEALIALRNFEESAQVNGLDYIAGVPGFDVRVDRLRVAMPLAQTSIDRALRTALTSGLWPIQAIPSPIPSGDVGFGAGGKERHCAGELLGSADGRRIVLREYRVQFVRPDDDSCSRLVPLFGVPPDAEVKTDPTLSFVVARIPGAGGIPNPRNLRDNAAWRFWVLYWHCLRQSQGRACNEWSVRSLEGGEFEETAVKGKMTDDDWKLEAGGGAKLSAFQDEITLVRRDRASQTVHRTVYRVFRSEPVWPGIGDNIPVAEGLVRGDWKTITDSSERCGPKSAEGAPKEFTTVDQRHGEARCVEIRRVAALLENGWPYTFRIYRTDVKSSSPEVAEALRGYPTAELGFVGPEIKDIRLDASPDGRADAVYVKTHDDRVFPLLSSLRELQSAGCRLIKDGAELLTPGADQEWSKVFKVLSLRGHLLRHYRDQPCS